MPDQYGQVRVNGDSTFYNDVTKIGKLLDDEGIAGFTAAALGSSYRFVAIDARALHHRIVGIGPPGIGVMTEEYSAGALHDGYTLWVVESHRRGSGWLMRGCLHDIGYLHSHDIYPGEAADVHAIGAVINHIEYARADESWSPGAKGELRRQLGVASADDLAERAKLMEEGGY